MTRRGPKPKPRPAPRAGIYAITDVASGRQYIGSSIDIDARWRQHLVTLRNKYHENRHLQAIYDDHGPAGLSLSVLEEVTDGRNLWAVEEEYLARHFAGPQRGGLNIRATTGRTRDWHAPVYHVGSTVVDEETRWLFERIHQQMGQLRFSETIRAMVHDCAAIYGIVPPTPQELAVWKQAKRTAA